MPKSMRLVGLLFKKQRTGALVSLLKLKKIIATKPAEVEGMLCSNRLCIMYAAKIKSYTKIIEAAIRVQPIDHQRMLSITPKLSVPELYSMRHTKSD